MLVLRGNYPMHEISLFYGIRITMNWSNHNPPHFHVQYGNNKAEVLIEIHKDELMQNWELSKDGKPLNRINPLI